MLFKQIDINDFLILSFNNNNLPLVTLCFILLHSKLLNFLAVNFTPPPLCISLLGNYHTILSQACSNYASEPNVLLQCAQSNYNLFMTYIINYRVK